MRKQSDNPRFDQRDLPKIGSWDRVPDNLKTKTGLAQLGLRLSKGQQPAAIKSHWHDDVPWYYLFDMSEAVPKRQPTVAQLAALEKAKTAALAARTCKGCGWIAPPGIHLHRRYGLNAKGLCRNCVWFNERLADQTAAIEWAHKLFQEPDGVLVLDTENCTLYGEIIDLALIDLAGEVRFNSRFRPVTPIDPEATAVHHLTVDMLQESPTWPERYDEIRSLLTNARVTIIYNAQYDESCLYTTCRIHQVEPIRFTSDCLMEWYAAFVNDWTNRRKDYRWHRLSGGDHTALGDAHAALAYLHKMAEAEPSLERYPC